MGNVSMFKPNDEGLGLCFTIPQLATTPTKQTKQTQIHTTVSCLPEELFTCIICHVGGTPELFPEWMGHRQGVAMKVPLPFQVYWLTFFFSLSLSGQTVCIFEGSGVYFLVCTLGELPTMVVTSHPQKKKCVSQTASIKVTLNQTVSAVLPGGSFGFLSFFLFSTYSTPFSSIPIQNTNDKRKDWPNFKVSSNLADQSGLTGISLPNHKHLIIYYHKPDFPLSEDEWVLHLPHWWKTFGSLCLGHWPVYWQGSTDVTCKRPERNDAGSHHREGVWIANREKVELWKEFVI